jgi:hypothetical protein
MVYFGDDHGQSAMETRTSSGVWLLRHGSQAGCRCGSFARMRVYQNRHFYAWRRKITGINAGPEDQDRLESSFIEVAIPQSNSSAVVELLLTSGNTMRIHPGIDSSTLGTVLLSLRQAGLC